MVRSIYYLKLLLKKKRGLGSRTRRILRTFSLGIAYKVRSLVSSETFLRFRCNICGFPNFTPLDLVSAREEASCIFCGSTLRWRTVVHVLSTELFGASLVLVDFPRQVNLKGLGLSDWGGYAEELSKKMNYTNTFFNAEPGLDLKQVDPNLYGSFDFVIASDVFEHVKPPVALAFANVRRILNDNGVLIFSVPYKKQGDTEEHFSGDNGHLAALEPESLLSEERHQDSNPTHRFHGGQGFTLEMRLFSEPSLRSFLSDAGFRDIKFCPYDCPEFGILSREDYSLVIAARPTQIATGGSLPGARYCKG